jgi:hypothetical protein
MNLSSANSCVSVEQAAIRAAYHLIAKEGEHVSFEPLQLPPIPEPSNDGRIQYIEVLNNSMFWKAGWLGATPPKSLVDRWYSRRLASAIACLPSGSYASGSRKSKSGISPRDESNSLEAGNLVKFGAPAISSDMKSALVLYSRRSGRLANTIEMLYLRYENENWIRRGSRVISVS